MGLRGPASTPSAINALRGNPGKRAPNAAEPKSRRVLPPGVKPTSANEITCARFKPPAHLDATAKEFWKRQVAIYSRMKVLTEADGPVLAHICILESTILKAEATLQKLGEKDAANSLLYKAASGYIMQSPLIGIRNNAMDLQVRLIKEFGGTPAARVRLVAGDDGKVVKSGVLNGQWPKQQVAESSPATVIQ